MLHPPMQSAHSRLYRAVGQRPHWVHDDGAVCEKCFEEWRKRAEASDSESDSDDQSIDPAAIELPPNWIRTGICPHRKISDLKREENGFTFEPTFWSKNAGARMPVMAYERKAWPTTP